MNNELEYKGYHTVIVYNSDDRVLCGKIEGINDLVVFESTSPVDIVDEFHKAVDDYLEFCKELNVSPDKTDSGNFNVRISPDCHRSLSMIAVREGVSLNTIVGRSCMQYINNYQNREKTSVFINVFTKGEFRGRYNTLNYLTGGLNHVRN